MTRTPLIGIIECSKYDNYANAIKVAGGKPIPLSHFDDFARQVSECDGILLPGGADFESSDGKHQLASNEEKKHYYGIIDKIMQTRKPLLGICLGFQAIALRHDCIFIKDMDTYGVEGIRNHKKNKTQDYEHEIDIPAESPLRSIFLKDTIRVHCNHHQAIAKLSVPFISAAYSLEDKIIEAGCLPNLEEHFVVGVQWHPERSTEDEANAKLFEAFVEHSRAQH